MHIVDPPDSVDDSRLTVKTRAERLRHAMNLRRIQTNELDRLAGIGAGWTSKFLNEQKPHPSAATLMKVCRALGIRSAWLMDGSGPMEAEQVHLDVAPSASRIQAPVAPRWHPDIEATIRIYRNKKKWSDAALVLADEIAKARHVEPDEIATMLDALETQIEALRSRFLP